MHGTARSMRHVARLVGTDRAQTRTTSSSASYTSVSLPPSGTWSRCDEDNTVNSLPSQPAYASSGPAAIAAVLQSAPAASNSRTGRHGFLLVDFIRNSLGNSSESITGKCGESRKFVGAHHEARPGSAVTHAQLCRTHGISRTAGGAVGVVELLHESRRGCILDGPE